MIKLSAVLIALSAMTLAAPFSLEAQPVSYLGAEAAQDPGTIAAALVVLTAALAMLAYRKRRRGPDFSDPRS